MGIYRVQQIGSKYKTSSQGNLYGQKNLYGRPSEHVNQRLANLVIDEQLPIWDKNNLRKYKKIYPTSKIWVL